MVKKSKSKKVKQTNKLRVYSNLKKKSIKHVNKLGLKLKQNSPKDIEKLEHLSRLPKKSFKRALFFINPKNFKVCWLNKKGGIRALKIIGVFLVILALLTGGLFAYFRKDLDSIRPSELAKNVYTNVNIYLDRNGELLWEDKGAGNYKVVVKSEEISDNVKKATVAIEDKDFYKHSGISLSGLLRALTNNFLGGSTQGGSTLTQQLIKQVFFSDEAGKRGLDGIPRKIKEVILAIEIERMYNKDQILTLYLNESPYGGRRNGVESGARTYFNKSSKDLSVAEAALLAAIPQNPSVYNPYNIAGNQRLINRQHAVINNMRTLKYITKEEAQEAKDYPILDHISPESEQYKNIKAPHFVQMVRAQLEKELGNKIVGRGGLTITTTLDLRIQNKLEEAMRDMFNSNTPINAGFSNGAATVADVKTNQIIALMGSRDFNYPGFGQDNATIASIQPGSSVKPFVFSKLFEKKPTGQLNFGSGSILKDENIDSLYGAVVRNADRAFKGDISIRAGLATSRNIPAIKAMYISGVQDTLKTIRELGANSYCTVGDEVNVGLASAIGGCGVKQVDMVSAYTSIARGGVYKPQSTVLEVKDSNNKIIKRWSDPAGKQVVSEQSTYIVSDILTDPVARAPLSGWNTPGMSIPGVRTATKTGTSDKGGMSKDIWMFSYSPALVMGVWLGNSDASTLRSGVSSMPGPIIEKVMSYAHKDIYAPAGLWSTNAWFNMPAGIQKINNEVYPSWWDKKQNQTEEKMVFDKLSRYRATEFTPELARIELDVIKTIDPITKKEIYIAPDGYDANKESDKHLATDIKPSVSINAQNPEANASNPNLYSILITPNVFNGSPYSITTIEIYVDNKLVKTMPTASSFIYSHEVSPGAGTKTINIHSIVIDDGYYSSQSSPVKVEIPKYKVPESPVPEPVGFIPRIIQLINR